MHSIVSVVLLCIAQCVFGLGAAAQVQARPSLLLTGDEFGPAEVPPEAAGDWWVLYAIGESTRLLRSNVVIEAIHDACIDDVPTAKSGRRVAVPGYDRVIMLVRGIPNLRSGDIPTAALASNGSGLTRAVEAAWSGGRTTIVGDVVGDGFRIVLGAGMDRDTLYHAEWQDEGSWDVRWAGDLNRDGVLDVLLDATHKYSVSTQRLFLSGEGGLREVATFTHTAC